MAVRSATPWPAAFVVNAGKKHRARIGFPGRGNCLLWGAEDTGLFASQQIQ